MPNYDIKDEYGGKVGEVRSEGKDFFTGERRFGIHDEYGGKVGGLQERRDYFDEFLRSGHVFPVIVILLVVGAIVAVIAVAVWAVFAAVQLAVSAVVFAVVGTLQLADFLLSHPVGLVLIGLALGFVLSRATHATRFALGDVFIGAAAGVLTYLAFELPLGVSWVNLIAVYLLTGWAVRTKWLVLESADASSIKFA